MKPYNGFSPRERRAWNGLVRPTPHRCSICACGPEERPLAYHGEDSARADSVYPICRLSPQLARVVATVVSTANGNTPIRQSSP